MTRAEKSPRDENYHVVVYTSEQLDLIRDAIEQYRDQIRWAVSLYSSTGTTQDSTASQAVMELHTRASEINYIIREHSGGFGERPPACDTNGCQAYLARLGFVERDMEGNGPPASNLERLVEAAVDVMQHAEKAIGSTKWVTREIAQAIADNSGAVTAEPATPDTADRARILLKSSTAGRNSPHARLVAAREIDVRDMESSARTLRHRIRQWRRDQGLPVDPPAKEA